MGLIEWNDEEYSIGIALMDSQHKQLVALINALAAQKQSADKAFLEKVFNTLVQYTLVHFAAEEKIMKKLHYQSLEPHKFQHKKFATKIESFQAEFANTSNATALVEQILAFLKDWLVDHILVHDKAYAQYLVG